MTPHDMSAHVHALAELHAVEVELGATNARGRAWRHPRKIRIPPVVNARTYAIALHELGHVISPSQRGLRVDREVDAWDWAKAHALEWSERMDSTRASCLTQYARWASRRQANDPRHRRFIHDRHPIWRYVYEDKL